MLLFNVCILTAAAVLPFLVSLHAVEGSRQDKDIPLRTKEEMGIQDVAYGDIHKAFFNDGHWTGWDAYHTEHKGRVEVVRNDCFERDLGRDNRCFKFSQIYDQAYRGRYHAEIMLYNATKIGITQYYGFAFKVPRNFEFSRGLGSIDQVMHHRISISQFIASFKDWDCGLNDKGYKIKKQGVPGIMVWIQNDNLYIRLRSGSPCDEKGPNTREFKVGKIIAGKWHTLVFGGKWSKDRDGWFKVWYDKSLRVDEEHVRTWMDVDQRMFQFRVGIYPNWWTWDGSGHPFIAPRGQKLKQVLIDHIGIGPNVEDADPWISSMQIGEGVKESSEEEDAEEQHHEEEEQQHEVEEEEQGEDEEEKEIEEQQIDDTPAST